MWYNKDFFKYVTGVILILFILYLLLQLAPILKIIFEFFVTLISPLLLAGVFYYILRPLQTLLEKKISKNYVIAIIYSVVILLLVIISLYIIPFINEQVVSLFSKTKMVDIKEIIINAMQKFNFKNLPREELSDAINNFFQGVLDWIAKDIGTIISRITQVTTLVILTPLILFYLLKDSRFFSKTTLQITPHGYKELVKEIMIDFDTVLSTYITGQFMVAVIVGGLMFFGYLIIGLQYAFLLSLFVLIFNMIPFIGTFLSMIPALLVGMAEGPWMVAKILLVIIGVHALDANLISPNILGPRLNIHPLTIILLLIASGSLYGIFGLLLATPVYALVKILVIDLYKSEKLEDLH
jgi:predicted PurR-regulated permease PerM